MNVLPVTATVVGNKKLHSLICSNFAQSGRLVLIFGELLEGVCTGRRYDFFVPKESMVGERRVLAKIRARKIKKLECVRFPRYHLSSVLHNKLKCYWNSIHLSSMVLFIRMIP